MSARGFSLPELAAFNVAEAVEPDIVVERRRRLGGRPRARIDVASRGLIVEYREHLGVASAAFDIDLSGPIRVEANWLLSWSHHVLYTNVVEPLLRFMLVSHDAVLLHCASLDADRGGDPTVGTDRYRQDEHDPAAAHEAGLGIHGR